VSHVRILYVSDTFRPQVNGVTTVLDRVVRRLRRDQHEVLVVAPRYANGDDSPGELRIPSMAFPPYPEIRLAKPALRRISRLVRRFAPDLVHVMTEGPLGLVGRMVATREGIPLVTSFHTDFPGYCRDYGVSWLTPLVWRWLTWFHGPATMTQTPGVAVRDALLARGLSHATLWGRNVDVAHFRPDRRSRAWRRAHRIPDDAVVICHVGRLAREKNIDVLLESWNLMRGASPRSIVFVVAGDGPLAPDVWRRAPFARHFGFVDRDRLATLYASSDLCVLPSLKETCGLVALEAMSSGLPVVAADAGGFRESIAHGQSGLLVSGDDPRAFAAAMVWLAFDHDFRRSLGIEARRQAELRDVTIEDAELLARYATIAGEATRIPCSVGS